jgi:hypothetical protein
MKSKIFHNLFSPAEIESIIDYFDQRPYNTIEEHDGVVLSKNKNMDYQIQESFCYKIVRPKINLILGDDHEIFMGCYKECLQSYYLHYDSPRSHSRFDSAYQLPANSKYNVAILIPLVENPLFKTVIFDIFDHDVADKNLMFDDSCLTSANDLDLTEFTHVSENYRKNLNKLPLDTVFPWRIGDTVIWSRDQLHTSTDFAKHDLVKKFLILFIA